MSWFKLMKKCSEEVPDGTRRFEEYNRILAKLTDEQRAEVREKMFVYWLAFKWGQYERANCTGNYLTGYLEALVSVGVITNDEKCAVHSYYRTCINLEVDWNWCDHINSGDDEEEETKS